MATHDVECSKCGLVIRNYSATPWPTLCTHDDCGGELVILWSTLHLHNAAAHPSQRTVVWQAPDGKVSYPPRNDTPIPKRYKEAGYQRVEFETAKAVERFEREKGVMCEKLWYNNGNSAQ
jgi:hypothetical protein